MVEPLKSRKKTDNELYERRPKVQEFLEKLDKLEWPKRVDLIVDQNGGLGEDVPVEALVYSVRAAWREGEDAVKERLFKALYLRVRASVLGIVPDSRVPNAAHIREEIVSEFVLRFARDCREQGKKLDFYEVQFNSAFAIFCISRLREIGPKQDKTVPLMGDGETSDETEIDPKVQRAAEVFFNEDRSVFSDPAFRSAFLSAINTLPADQKTVMGLLLKGYPIDSKFPEKQTIARLLKCTERTVRNRRDRAFEALHSQLEKAKTDAAQ